METFALTDRRTTLAVAATSANARDNHVLEFLRWKEQHSVARWFLNEQIPSRGVMQFELMTADGRLFGFDIWDWSMIIGGSLLVSLIALLV
jgi:hypothetical protein